MKMQKLMGALILILMLGATPVTAQNMSDSQVLEYVKEGIRQGKEQKQLAPGANGDVLIQIGQQM